MNVVKKQQEVNDSGSHYYPGGCGYAYNDLHSKAVGAIGQKVVIDGLVLYQSSYAVDTLIGRTYSHFHIIGDRFGNIYHYKGSSLFPKQNTVHCIATVKAHKRGSYPMSMITIIKAPKVAQS